eukprot:3063951-Prymnesium_polylepis.1
MVHTPLLVLTHRPGGTCRPVPMGYRAFLRVRPTALVCVQPTRRNRKISPPQRPRARERPRCARARRGGARTPHRRAPGPLRPIDAMTAANTQPAIALGVLSSAGTAGTATASAYVYRRTTVREGLLGFRSDVLQRVAVRFLLAGRKITKSFGNNVRELRTALEENRTHGDMIFMDMCASTRRH